MAGARFGNYRSFLTFAVATAVTGGCDDQTGPEQLGPPIESLRISPANPFIDLGDTLVFSADAFDAAGDPITADSSVTWSSASARVRIDSTGLATGMESGSSAIRATAWNGVTDSVVARVTPVQAFVPSSGLYGEVITIQGVNLPVNADIFFSGENRNIQAFVRQATATSLTVWVPPLAVSGPLHFESAAGSFRTSHTFAIGGNDDLFEENDDGFAQVSSPPFYNPALLARGDELDLLVFTLGDSTPGSIFLLNTGARNDLVIPIAFVARYGTSGEFMGVVARLIPFNFATDQHRDSTVWSLAALPPGQYGLQISALDLGQNETPDQVAYGYGIRTTTDATFAFPPDSHEPNDFPRAANVAVSLPFDESGLFAENGQAVDCYVFDLSGANTLDVHLDAFTGDMDVYLLAGDSGGLFTTADIVAVSADMTSTESFTVDVSPGRYTLVVHNFGVNATAYDLTVEAAATAATATGASVAAGSGRGPGWKLKKMLRRMPAVDFPRVDPVNARNQ